MLVCQNLTQPSSFTRSWDRLCWDDSGERESSSQHRRSYIGVIQSRIYFWLWSKTVLFISMTCWVTWSTVLWKMINMSVCHLGSIFNWSKGQRWVWLSATRCRPYQKEGSWWGGFTCCKFLALARLVYLSTLELLSLLFNAYAPYFLQTTLKALSEAVSKIDIMYHHALLHNVM